MHNVKNPDNYVRHARQYIGMREISGPEHNPVITKWLQRLKAWWHDDETPWCGVAVGAWLHNMGIVIPSTYYRALTWIDWGEKVAEPCYGAVAVIKRKGGGHVGLVIGVSKDRRFVKLLGGNQNNAVNETWFATGVIVGYRMPPGYIQTPAPLLDKEGSNNAVNVN